MGVFDKIKNFFYDEEEVADKTPVKEAVRPKEEPKEEKPLVEAEKIKRRTGREDVENVVSERELFKSEPTFKFPVIFEEEDFVEEKKKNHSMNILDVENNKREEKKITFESKKAFRPSLIISPIYGVLDKNYKKEDISARNDSLLNLYEKGAKIDLDSVIEKAYGRYQKEEPEESFNESSDKGLFYNLKEEEDVSSTPEAIDLFNDIEEDVKKPPKKKTKEVPVKEKIELEVEILLISIF